MWSGDVFSLWLLLGWAPPGRNGSRYRCNIDKKFDRFENFSMAHTNTQHDRTVWFRSVPGAACGAVKFVNAY